MSVPWFTKLKSFIRRVLGLHMPSILDAVFGGQGGRFETLSVHRALNSYIITVALIVDGTLSYPDSSPRIRTIRLKKCLSTAEHEYILVELVSGNGPLASDVVIGELKVERSYDRVNGNALMNCLADSSASSTISTPSGTDSSIKEPIPARDSATFQPQNTRADTTVFLHTFDEASAPSVLDLLVAANTLNVHSPHYILFQRQCYWFAGMILRILLGDIDADPIVLPEAVDTPFSPAYVPPTTVSNPAEPVEPAQPVEPAEPVLAGAAGTFKKLFTIVTKKEIDSLYNREIKQFYQSKRAEVDEQLRAARERPARQLQEAARAAREDTARQVEEAARAAREEATQAAHKETARQVEEATRAAREEATQAMLEIARMRDEIARLKAA